MSDALHRDSSPWPARRTSVFRAGSREWPLGRATFILGILNVTPDSFSDGGECATHDAVEHRLAQIAEEGADMVDIGGESTRPGAIAVDVEDEWQRIHPTLKAVHRMRDPLPVSVDTMKPEVARRALDEGAIVINDVSALRAGPAIAELAARAGAGLILMHMKGEPRTMQVDPRYDDLLGDIRGELAESVRVAEAAGVPAESILVDPGIGFGKTVEHNLALVRNVGAFAGLGAGVLIGTSRKSFIGKLLGDAPVDQRLEGSLASFVGAILAGAHAIRVHDVRAAVRAARIADALRGNG